MASVLVDTHVLIWLYEGLLSRIPASVQQRLNEDSLAASPFSQLELGYLHEVGRIQPSPDTVISELTVRLGLTIVDVPSADLCRAALALTWTRDPFDRLLAAHATVANLPLITRDATM